MEAERGKAMSLREGQASRADEKEKGISPFFFSISHSFVAPSLFRRMTDKGEQEKDKDKGEKDKGDEYVEKMEAAIQKMQQQYADHTYPVLEGVTTLKIYTSNLLRNPFDRNFYKIKAKNTHFLERVGHLAGAIDAMNVIGYKLTGEYLVFDESRILDSPPASATATGGADEAGVTTSSASTTPTTTTTTGVSKVEEFKQELRKVADFLMKTEQKVGVAARTLAHS